MLLVFSFQIKMFAFKINLTVKDNIKNMFLQWFKGYATLMDVVINELYCAIFLSVCVFGVGHTVFYTIYIYMYCDWLMTDVQYIRILYPSPPTVAVVSPLRIRQYCI